MGHARIPGPLSESPSIEPASPSAPVTGLDQPGPVGLEGESDPCEGSPQLVDWPRSLDDETQHGLDVQAQRRWKAAIQAAIDSGKPI
jgi:hypothetical protein